MMIKFADISPCGKYRYSLTRRFERYLPLMNFVMLNPSTADAQEDDPTIRRCLSFAKRFTYGGIEVFNLFAYRTKNPADLLTVEDPFGPENDRELRDMSRHPHPIICAWGVGGTLLDADKKTLSILRENNNQLACLGKTKGGHPRHPLYVKGDQPLEWV